MIRPNPDFLEAVPAKVRAKWAKALLTTKARQLRGRMFRKRDGKTYMCCLMVGHNAFGGTDEQRDSQVPQEQSPFTIAMGHFGGNPEIGLDETNDETPAAWFNDQFELSFREIAALVYPQLWRLEKRKQK